MECQDYKILLSAYIDKELTPAQTEQVDRHLLACPDCAAVLSALQGATGAVAALPRLQLPPAAAGRLEAAVNERLEADAGHKEETAARTRPAPWRQFFTRPAFVSVATAIGVLALAAVVWTGPGQQSQLNLEESLTKEAAPAPGGQGADSASDLPRAQKDSGKTSGPAVLTKQSIDRLLDQAVAGTLPDPKYGNANRPPLTDKPLGFNARVAGPVALDDAARIAAGGAKGRLLAAVSGLYDGQAAWLVILERADKPGALIGAAVSQEDGRILNRQTRQRP